MLSILMFTIVLGSSQTTGTVIKGSGSSGNITVPKITFVTLGQRGIIPLPKVANYRRIITSQGDIINDEQLFSFCNKKNKKTCGFWISVQSRKKVEGGATNYNKKLKALVIQNMTKMDLGMYMTGNRKISTFVMEKSN